MMISAEDFRARARRKLPHFLFEYYDGAAFDGLTAERNRHDLHAMELRQRVLCDVSGISTATHLLGEAVSLPLALSPVGLAGMAARRGEVLAAKAARSRNIPMALSTTSVCPLDEVAAVKPPWFQLYMVRDRGFVADMLDWAVAQGCTTLLFTVDLPVLGTRWRDHRSGLNQAGLTGALRRYGQMLARPRWAAQVGVTGGPHNLGNIAHHLGRRRASLADCMAYTSANMEACLDWSALDWVRHRWPGTLVVKGIMEGEDARLALGGGADAIIISNHGGRQLDGAASTVRALRRVVDHLEGRLPLLVDGGVRTGLDMLRMLAVGATGVMLGRPWVYALAAGGQAGVERLIDILEQELRIAMALCGCRSVQDISRDILRF
ncbi:L-lactate dehydrogenase [Sphingobium lactosutens]|uniref:L-lactate dehydrogenase n=1 Tax=Sphingobium lactosutens TaxID=522773 RepID=UPI0015BE1A0C|nr:L-lactate dehydrogenase [Sphingobium lactosutens]NWK98736.1 L-lactate dehydrogenase [Sphingobium lactosutens]